jgi:hypothetical protein
LRPADSELEDEPKYTVTGLIKGTATLDEIRTLLLNWKPGEEPREYAKRVQLNGILTKKTARRVNDLVLRVFRPWFLVPDDRAATQLKALVKADIDRRILNELVFIYKARSEAVLYDFVRKRFWPACQDGALYLSTEEILDFLHESQEEGRVDGSWSSKTQERLARGILGALNNIGFLREEKRYLYEYVYYFAHDCTIAYLAYDFHLAGLSDNATVNHSDWMLFGLARSQVLDRLARLDERAGMIVQQAGSVVQITWSYKTMDEVINAYSG